MQNVDISFFTAAEVPAVEVSDPLCPICELVVHEIDNMISDNKTEVSTSKYHSVTLSQQTKM